MCNSNVKSAGVAQIDGRPVLQPAGNRVAAPEGAKPLKKSLQKSLSMPASYDNVAAAAATCTAAPKSTGAGDFARAAAATPYLLPPTPAKAAGAKAAGARAAASTGADKNRKQAPRKSGAVLPVVTFAALEAFELAGPAGSIAAAQREHVTQAQAQRKMRIAHYGRTASFSRVEGKVGATATATATAPAAALEEKRCSFITAYSDPVYVAYHDEEWGVPVHEDE
ncbi:unnamed protein product [Triticum turgidum subsp. durum]|nr:unnamed protein product [Triticum turgidum subsp. durum]